MAFFNKKQNDYALEQLLKREITAEEKLEASTRESYSKLSGELLNQTIRVHEFIYREETIWKRPLEAAEWQKLQSNGLMYNCFSDPPALVAGAIWTRKLLNATYRGVTAKAFTQWALENLSGRLLNDVLGPWILPTSHVKALSKNKNFTGEDFANIVNKIYTKDQLRLVAVIDESIVTPDFVAEAMYWSESAKGFSIVCDLARKVFEIDKSIPDKWVAQMFDFVMDDDKKS